MHCKELAPSGGLLNSTSCLTVYPYMGHAQFALCDPSKGHLVQLILVYSQFYTSFRLHRQLLLLQNPLFLDPSPVEGQHTELLMHNQGIHLL